MVGRGLRLMFHGPEFFETKRQALEDIAGGQQPSALLDFLFIVEHPRFRQFYDNLRKEGYPVFQGDSRSVVTSGDLTPVPYDENRLRNFDMAWPVQFHDEGKTPDPSKIPVASLPLYPMPFSDVRKEFNAITIGDVHEPTGKVTSTWRLQTGIFDYGFFLREVANQIVTNKENTILSARRAELMALIDEYASAHLFGEKVDFTQEENYRVLAHIPIFDFVTTHIRRALVELLGKVVYEPQGLWERISKVHQILVRKKNVVATTKCIYPMLSPAPKGGGFEYRFMYECLERSQSVLAYVKLDQHKHNFAVRYRNEFGIARDYYPDFIVKTKDKMYLVETKGDRDMSSPVVARKARAAIGWCEAASGIQPPAEFNQPQEWEYVLLSEKSYNHHGRAGFDALLSACRAELQQLLAFGQGRLF
jgi:type III restriction enzyme